MSTVEKKPSHSCPRYVVARIRKLFAAKGWTLHVVKGRYRAFNSEQSAAEGFSVSKVGCGKNVSVDYNARFGGGRSGVLPKEVRAAKRTEAIEYLRSLGYRVDDRGWIECDSYDTCDR